MGEMINMEYYKLNNNIEIPALGIGTFLLKPDEAENSVKAALEIGYRLVDTASMYRNEKSVGKALKESNIDREDIFVSTKLWPTEYEDENAVQHSLDKLGLDYIDLLFLHQPAGDYMKGFEQLEKAYDEGLIKSIGLSNFDGKFLNDILSTFDTLPQVVQAETHPYYPETDLRKTLDKNDIKLMSWYPLGHGDSGLINEDVFKELGEKYGKSPVQIILRWHIDMGFIVIPGSKNVQHIKDNFDIFDFRLSKSDMEAISKINRNERFFHPTEEKLKRFATMMPAD